MKILKRELLIAAIIVAATLLVVLPVTYVVGSKTLGPYGEDGGLWRFLGQIFAELGGGNLAIWFYLLSPLLAISFARLGWLAFRRL